MNGRGLALILTAFGMVLGAAALLSARESTTAAELPLRARLPLLAADSASAPTPTGLVFCTVTHIVDGDTIDVAGCPEADRVRLILLDTPEISPGECFGKQAAEYTSTRLLNRQVGLERDLTNRDFFGRLLRYVWVDGALFNEEIVANGFAALGEYPPDLKYRDRITAAQAEAQLSGRGLWPVCGGIGVPGTPTPQSSPTATSPATATTFGTATATPTLVAACFSAAASIVALDKVLEIVTVSGSGNLTGWYLISTRGNQRFDFPAGFILGGSVEVRSGTPPFPNSAGALWWSQASQWNNSEDDDAILYNCAGAQVDYFDDGD